MEATVAQGKSHGKIILMGEHAVVYGEPSIALPFPAVEMTATVRGTKGPILIDCSFYQGIAQQMPEVLDSLKTAIKTALSSLGRPYENLAIAIKSTIPPERGMGSSAAVAVAVTRAIYNYFQQELSQEKLLELVHVSEQVAHGNPSGLDAAMTSGNTPLYFRKGQPFEAFSLHMDAWLVVGDTGKTGQTREAVGSIGAKMDTSERSETLDRIRKLGELAEQAREALQKNQPLFLGKAMDKAHALLSELEVSSAELDALVESARTAGALGAKLTGGGRGGCMIALAESEADADRIQTALKEAGAVHTWIASLQQEVQA